MSRDFHAEEQRLQEAVFSDGGGQLLEAFGVDDLPGLVGVLFEVDYRDLVQLAFFVLRHSFILLFTHNSFRCDLKPGENDEILPFIQIFSPVDQHTRPGNRRPQCHKVTETVKEGAA